MFICISYHLSVFDVFPFSCLFSVVGVYGGARPKDAGSTGLDAYFDAGVVTKLMVETRTEPHKV